MVLSVKRSSLRCDQGVIPLNRESRKNKRASVTPFQKRGFLFIIGKMRLTSNCVNIIVLMLFKRIDNAG